MVAQIKKKEMSFMVSADKNETDDDFIADFAMGVQADFIKFGAPAQGERVAKYNRLLKIEQLALMNKPTAAPKKINATPLPKALLDRLKK
jgi:enolase